MKRILVGSPIKQKPEILREFLCSLSELIHSGLELDFYFINDNDDSRSNELLHSFKMENSKVYIEDVKGESTEKYVCDQVTHSWKEVLIWKVAAFKDRIIKEALAKGYDYLFFIDSDLVLHPATLLQLLFSGKDIISEIFWTRWRPEIEELPQVWLSDQYDMCLKVRGENLSQEDAVQRTRMFLDMLKEPGIYRVGGLGACTLISRTVLRKGVCFQPIYNLSFWGEDRHFCIRAVAMDLELFVDTTFPAYHIYREEELAGVQEYKRKNSARLLEYRWLAENKQAEQGQGTAGKSKIVLAMLVRNESGRYLERVLENALPCIDEAVILDDASEDDTVEICHRMLATVPHKIISNEVSMFHQEFKIRKQLWELAISANPDWILCLDADEILEEQADEIIREIAKKPDIYTYSFKLYDFWDEEHYREDQCWQAHKFYRPFMVRYKPGFTYRWRETAQHCGRFPYNILELPGGTCELAVKHMGWVRPEDRLKKYERYMKFDPDGKYGIKEQYLSILDKEPPLIKWKAGR